MSTLRGAETRAVAGLSRVDGTDPSGRPTGSPENVEITAWRWGAGRERRDFSVGERGILRWRPRAGARHGRERYGVAGWIRIGRISHEEAEKRRSLDQDGNRYGSGRFWFFSGDRGQKTSMMVLRLPTRQPESVEQACEAPQKPGQEAIQTSWRCGRCRRRSGGDALDLDRSPGRATLG